jgi:hypothetical protein
MDSNEVKSRSVFNKFGIDSLSHFVQKELDNRYIEDQRLFFEFTHLNDCLRCRLAYKGEDDINYECYISIRFDLNPYECTIAKSYLHKKERKGIKKTEYLYGLDPLDFDDLVDRLTQKETVTTKEKLNNILEKVAAIFNR